MLLAAMFMGEVWVRFGCKMSVSKRRDEVKMSRKNPKDILVRERVTLAALVNIAQHTTMIFT